VGFVKSDHQILQRPYTHPYWQAGLLAQEDPVTESNIPRRQFTVLLSSPVEPHVGVVEGREGGRVGVAN
jgi:hypothetical protein